MGDPKRRPNLYSGPRHPWEAARIAEEKKLLRDYGLKNKTEIWKLNSRVSQIKTQVKQIMSAVDATPEEKEAIVKKLVKLNLIREDQSLDEALELSVQSMLERRLQTQLVRQGLARTMRQARQFIVHGHVRVGGKQITAPGYILTRDEQFKLEFHPGSNFADPEHPERKVPEAVVAEEKEVVDKKQAPETIEEELEKEVAEAIEGSDDEAPAEETAEKTEVKNE